MWPPPNFTNPWITTLVGNCLTGALAHLGLARAHALIGDRNKGRRIEATLQSQSLVRYLAARWQAFYCEQSIFTKLTQKPDVTDSPFVRQAPATLHFFCATLQRHGSNCHKFSSREHVPTGSDSRSTKEPVDLRADN
jgi:hypothetical protein